ncbi:class I SAM-dependent methyltransferase [Streptomyces sp. NPDC052687]|uniref:class I SAM-dependent methyltransferase n=1 Tax=Streptomyces sp. NPDC052687 TaxID=3154759 RepID=UPI0034414D48
MTTTTPPPSPSRILEIASGYWATALLGTATQHSLFTHIHHGHTTPDQLTHQTGLAPRGIQTLLDGLVGLGLLTTHNGTYHNTPETTHYLIEGQPNDITGFPQLKLNEMNKINDRLDIFQTGQPPTRPETEIADNPHWHNVVTAIANLTIPAAHKAAHLLNLPQQHHPHILDIGGGLGTFSRIFLQLNPTAHATQLDWQPINNLAEQHLTQHHLNHRFTTINGNFHTTPLPPNTYDIAIYSHIAHQESPHTNTQLLTKIRHTLKPHGTLIINDYITHNQRTGPPFPLLFTSEMLLKSNHGNTWTHHDYTTWLTQAGYTTITHHPTHTPTTLILAQ